MKHFALTATLLLLLAWNSAAHNNLFFPGDAYFSSELKPDSFEDGSVEKGLPFVYERLVGTTAKCGYAGYENLLVKNLSQRVLDHLLMVQKIAFPKGSEKAKSLPLFIYNRDFPLSSPFGVKYNEHWQEIQIGEAALPYAIYDELGGSDFVIDDWASAKDIPPLAIADKRAPMVKPDGETGVVETALEIDGTKVMFVILLGGDGEVRRFAKREEGLVFFVVTEQLRRYRFDRTGAAMPQRVDTPFDDVAAKRMQIREHHVALRAAINAYKLNYGIVPTKVQGLDALVKKPTDNAPASWMPLLKKLPVDPWGKPYRWDGEVLFSLGADGVESEDDVVEPFLLDDEGEYVPPDDPGG